MIIKGIYIRYSLVRICTHCMHPYAWHACVSVLYRHIWPRHASPCTRMDAYASLYGNIGRVLASNRIWTSPQSRSVKIFLQWTINTNLTTHSNSPQLHTHNKTHLMWGLCSSHVPLVLPPIVSSRSIQTPSSPDATTWETGTCFKLPIGLEIHLNILYTYMNADITRIQTPITHDSN